MAITDDSKELLQAQLELWHHAFGYVKSMALAVALDLGIADAIHRRGGAATLSQILAEAALSPCKLHGLRRLMRALTVAGTFTVATSSGYGGDVEAVYELTPTSRLLVNDDGDGGDGSTASLSPVLSLVLNPFRVSPLGMGIGAWFRQEDGQPGVAPFAVAHGRNMWEMAARKPAFNALVNDAMAADSRFLMRIVLRECAEVFHGVTSLVDVAGGLGGAATSIARAFPEMRCSVLDLPHVVANAPSGGNVQFVSGDMFQSIPPADAVFLKVNYTEIDPCTLHKSQTNDGPKKYSASGNFGIPRIVNLAYTKRDVNTYTVTRTNSIIRIPCMHL
ncbi:5-pentadecatrienyl resorcinol O-methyltransferase [Dichanthelium oligosanthes]|uniref:5-pentadecatrienyl resorcinol O-methyltransferase n=1 Tax=Dichanthelium oligosanthes TaxID=888268 RepID=A0A1E5UVW5_9POAL|nr:5-pentadecatrienyl resorcinol O-methyltransferase [Dichanthelium oligosanthes]